MKKTIVQNKNLQKAINLVVILGGGLVNDKKTGIWRTTGFYEGDKFGVDGSRLRVVAGALLFKKSPESIIIASGGKGQLKKVKGVATLAVVIKRELMALGIPARKIIKEEKSSNTYTQLLELSKLTRNSKFNIKQILIVSNSWHLMRIELMAKFFPPLVKLPTQKFVKFLSAEKVCLKYQSMNWRNIINKAYHSAAMKKRISLERAGIRDIKNGKYKF